MKHKWQGIRHIILSLMLMVTYFILPANVLIVEAATSWSASMTAVTDTEGSNPSLIFGAIPGASDGLDIGQRL